MGSTTAYSCDGPECAVLTTKLPNTQSPAHWPRLTLHVNGAKTAGSFHDGDCAQAWLEEKLAIAATPVPLAAAVTEG